MVKINSKKAGFSLIELLFAMVFLSVIVFGVIKLQTSNLTLSNTKQLELKAYSYAGQALEVVSALGLAGIPTCDATPSTTCYLKITGDVYSIVEEENGFENLDDLFQRTIDRNDDGLLSGATLVTATVEWTDSSGEHHVSVKRVIFK